MMNMRRNISREEGLSLLEMAVVIIISGILFTIAINVYKHSLKRDVLLTLFENNRELQGALTEYRSITGRYPCPADPTLPPTDPNYGIENCGINIVATTRDSNGDLIPDNILIGSFPFDTVVPALNNSEMTATNTFDPWGNKYTYVVTENLTNAATYNDFWGTIRVVDEFDQSLVEPVDKVHALVISHGKNERGAYSAQGQLIDPFPILPPGPPPPPGAPLVTEIENANHLDITNSDGVFLAGLFNESDLYYNDDFVGVQISQLSGLWQVVDVDTSVVPPMLLISNMNPGNVGIGIQDPTERLEIAGNLKAGQVHADSFCDEAGADCMPVTRITAPTAANPDMQCQSAGEAVTGFENNARVCGAVFPSPVPVSCDPATEYMNGFSNLGNAICFPR